MGPQGVYISNCLHSNPSAYTHIHWITIFFSSKNLKKYPKAYRQRQIHRWWQFCSTFSWSGEFIFLLKVFECGWKTEDFSVNPRSNLSFSHPIYYFLEPKITQLRRYRYLSKNKNSRFFSFLFSIFCNCLQIQNFLVKLRQPAEF